MFHPDFPQTCCWCW